MLLIEHAQPNLAGFFIYVCFPGFTPFLYEMVKFGLYA